MRQYRVFFRYTNQNEIYYTDVWAETPEFAMHQVRNSVPHQIKRVSVRLINPNKPSSNLLSLSETAKLFDKYGNGLNSILTRIDDKWGKSLNSVLANKHVRIIAFIILTFLFIIFVLWKVEGFLKFFLMFNFFLILLLLYIKHKKKKIK